MKAEVREFLDRCNSCGKCKRVCPYLSSHGTPDRIISEKPQDAFLCTNCRACSAVCPQALAPSEALLGTKHQMIKEGRVPDSTLRVLKGARAFALRGHRFPFAYYASSDTVFWPGCALSGTSPKVVRKTADLLSRQLRRKVGIVLDCCFDSSFQTGDLDMVEMASEGIQERLRAKGIQHVIVGCTNCRKVFSLYPPGVRIEHVFDVIPENAVPELPFKSIYLHHPCPSFRFDDIRRKVKRHLEPHTEEIREPAHSSCCGLGGGLCALSDDLTDKFRDRVVTASGEDAIVTYCMGCKNRFLKNGKKTYHMLEFLTGSEPLEKPVSSGRKWVNRFFLALGQRLKGSGVYATTDVLFLPERLTAKSVRDRDRELNS